MEPAKEQYQINYEASMAKADLEFKMGMQYLGVAIVAVLAMISIWF